MNAWARFLTFVAPVRMQRAAEAQLSHMLVERVRGFDSANTLHRLRGRVPQPLGPKAELAAARPNTLAVSRDLDHNVSWVHGVWNAIGNNVVGQGIKPEPRILKRRKTAADRPGPGGLVFDDLRGKAAMAVWDRWAAGVDLHRRMSLYDMQWHVQRELDVAGEVLVVMSMVKDGREVPLVLDLVAAERLDSNDRKELSSGNEVIQGIEFDEGKKIVAYHIWEEDPADTIKQQTPTRVPAERVLHLFAPHRPGAIRGMPRIHSVARTFEALAQYLDWELTRARIASAFALMVKRGGKPVTLPQNLPSEDTTDDAGNPIGQIEGGMIIPGGPSDGFETASANIPSTSFEPFVKLMIRSAAVGINVSYGFLARDYSDSNFSAARMQSLEDRRNWRPRQTFIVTRFNIPVAEEFFRQAKIADVAPFSEMRADEFALRWRTQGWEWVDPEKEVKADIEAIKAGLKSPQECALEHGRDFYETVEQIAQAEKFCEEHGVTLSVFAQEFGETTDGPIQKKKTENPGSQAFRKPKAVRSIAFSGE